jgi:hypothetical protein
MDTTENLVAPPLSCPSCDGDGHLCGDSDEGPWGEGCEDCGGSGVLTCAICRDGDAVVVDGEPACAGCARDLAFERACDRILPLVIRTSYELTLQQATQREAA